MSRDTNSIGLEFHVDPQFVHRHLASQALGADAGAIIKKVVDQVTGAILDRQVPDMRIMAIKEELNSIEHQVATVRSGSISSGRDLARMNKFASATRCASMSQPAC